MKDCNDNLIKYWYSDKLIRLPIKINTLAFNKTTDNQFYEKFKIRIHSKEGKEALLRSEEITKTFIHDIQNRFKNNKIEYSNNHQNSSKQRFLVKLRVKVI